MFATRVQPATSVLRYDPPPNPIAIHLSPCPTSKDDCCHKSVSSALSTLTFLKAQQLNKHSSGRMKKASPQAIHEDRSIRKWLKKESLSCYIVFSPAYSTTRYTQDPMSWMNEGHSWSHCHLINCSTSVSMLLNHVFKRVMAAQEHTEAHLSPIVTSNSSLVVDIA